MHCAKGGINYFDDIQTAMRGNSATQPMERLTELDAMRGFAAFLVLGYHIHAQFGGFTIFARSYLAVDFFFMLSGFVMARTYEERLREGRLSPISFIVARYRRLWGPVFVGTIIGATYFALKGQVPTFGTLLVGATLIPALGIDRPYPLNRPTWSIFFEIMANAIHALILCRLSTRAVSVLAMASAAVLAIYCASLGQLAVGYLAETFWGGVPRVMVAYCLGIVIYRCRFRIRASSGTATLAMTIILLGLPPGLAWDMLFVAVICPLLIAAGARSFKDRFSSLVGALSFPLYAIHYPIIQLFRHLGAGPLTTVAAVLCAAVLVGVAIDRRLLETVRTMTIRGCKAIPASR